MCSRRRPASPHVPRQVRERPRRAAERLDVEDLRAQVHVEADHIEARLGGQAPQQRRGELDGHAELVEALPGGDVRVGVGVDVRVHPQGDPGLHAARAGQRVDAVRFAVRLDVDGLHAEGDRVVELVARLADAGEDDLRRLEAGPQGRLDLAPRVRVGAGAEVPEQAQDGERGVRLEGVVNGVGVSRERRVEGGARAPDEARAVDVDGRPGPAGDLRHRNAVAGQLPVSQGESDHNLGILSEASRV